jgi:hypothetical protein
LDELHRDGRCHLAHSPVGAQPRERKPVDAIRAPSAHVLQTQQHQSVLSPTKARLSDGPQINSR